MVGFTDKGTRGGEGALRVEKSQSFGSFAAMVEEIKKIRRRK
jgi:hypothetical protein